MSSSPKYGYYPDPNDTSRIEYGSYRTAARNYPYVDAETARANRAADEAGRNQPRFEPGERGADVAEPEAEPSTEPGPEGSREGTSGAAPDKDAPGGIGGGGPQSDGKSAEAPRRRKTVLRSRQEQDDEEEQARVGTTLLRSRRR